MARIKSWQEHCDKYHRGTCHNLSQWQTFPAATDLILIDVRQSCLLRIANTSNYKYVALSYVWGQQQKSLELNSSNLRELCAVGYLKRPEIASQIPKTVLDAVVLVRKLRLQLLWVDRLCIVQDPPDHLTRQLQQWPRYMPTRVSPSLQRMVLMPIMDFLESLRLDIMMR